MTWICPTCKKRFRNRNQEHSCALVDIERHFKNKSPEIRTIYDRLMAAIRNFGTIEVNSVKTSIQVRAGANFLSIMPKRNKVQIEFQLNREVLAPPVYRNLRISRNRVLHYAVLESTKDINARMIRLLRESYDLVRNQKQVRAGH